MSPVPGSAVPWWSGRQDRAGAPPALVACSHGTASATGRAAVARLRAEIGALRPGLEVLEAYVDVQRPRVHDVMRRLADRRRPAVVVPLLLAAGYHVRVDIAGAVAAGGGLATAPLGPHPLLVDVLLDRLTAYRPDPAAVVLAAAGSGDPRATAEVALLADTLGRRLDRPVTPAYLSAAQPDVAAAVSAALAASGGPVGVLSYLLAPGFFAERLDAVARAAGASWVTMPLAGHPALARLALRRYDEARAAAGVPAG